MGTITVELNVNPVVLRMMESAPAGRLSLGAGSTIHDLLTSLGLGPRGSRLLLSVNGRVVDRLTPLAEGDRVTIMPVLGGG